MKFMVNIIGCSFGRKSAAVRACGYHWHEWSASGSMLAIHLVLWASAADVNLISKIKSTFIQNDKKDGNA